MRILIIHPGALGDLLLAIPAIISLRARRRDHCSITVIAGASFLSFLEHHQIADSTTSVDSRALAALCSGELKPDTEWGDFYAGFDIVIAWMEDSGRTMESSLRTLGVPHVLIQSPHGAGRFRVSFSEWYLSSVRRFCDNDIADCLIVTPTDQELEAGSMVLRQEKAFHRHSKFFAVHIGSGSSNKNWDLQRFIDVILYIKDLHDISPIILFGPADEEAFSALLTSPRIADSFEFPVLKDLSLLQLVGVLGHCSAYIGNDSGVTHLSATIAIPTLAIFGTTDPMLWATLRFTCPVFSREYIMSLFDCRREAEMSPTLLSRNCR